MFSFMLERVGKLYKVLRRDLHTGLAEDWTAPAPYEVAYGLLKAAKEGKLPKSSA